MGLKERAAERRKHMVCQRFNSFEEAEKADLEYWQSFTPRERISIMSAMQLAVGEAIEKIMKAREAKKANGA